MKLSLGGFSTVTMTDRWFQELRAARAFGRTGAQVAVAGQYSNVQLKNPAASGKQAIVAEIRILLTVADFVTLRSYDTDCTTLLGTLTNLLMGAAAGVSTIRTEAAVARLGTEVTEVYCAANVWTVLLPSWGPEVSSGSGIVLEPATANVGLTVAFLTNEA